MSVALVVDHGQMEQQIDHGFIGVSPSMNDRSLDDMKLHGAVVRADDTIDGDDDDLKVTPDLKGQNRDHFIRGGWTPEEDAALVRLVGESGPKKWRNIALSMPQKRNPKQCRERCAR